MPEVINIVVDVSSFILGYGMGLLTLGIIFILVSGKGDK